MSEDRDSVVPNQTVLLLKYDDTKKNDIESISEKLSEKGTESRVLSFKVERVNNKLHQGPV